MFEKRIVQGVPFLVIHSVENSEKPVLPPAQKSIQSAPEFLRRDFARVTRTHRRNRIGKRDSGLEAVQLFVKLRALNGEKFFRQICQRECGCRKSPLKSEIVNRQA